MKTLVTHTSPDLDAITSCWLIQTYLPGWDKADLMFVPAGTTLNNKDPDKNPEVIHVDTGYGKFDHHQTGDFTCASRKVFDYLVIKKYIPERDLSGLDRLITFVTDDDHFMEATYPNPTADMYDLLLSNIVRGLKLGHGDHEVSAIVYHLLDASLGLLRNKAMAEQEITSGFVFKSYLGKSIAMETVNESTIGVAQKMGFNLVIRKDPRKGNVRIKTPPDKSCDLTPLYNEIVKRDKVGTWFLHASKHMLLNGSPKRPDQIPSPLTLQELIEISRSI